MRQLDIFTPPVIERRMPIGLTHTPTTSRSDEGGRGMQLIPLDKITRNPNQPRETFPQEHIERLAASIKAHGLIQPITLRPFADGYMIVAGECRYRAHQLLGADAIKAEIVSIDDEEMALQAIIENLQRQDMNPIEEARAYQSLTDRGYSPQKIVDELGLNSTAIVVQRLTLLNLTAEVQRLVITGQLAVTMAWGVAQVSHERQHQLVRDIASGKLRTAEQVKHAAIALREAEQQIDAFADLPKPSAGDLVVISRLEAKIEAIAEMVSLGFKEGECVAAQRIAPDRIKTMADKLVLVRKHVLQMEHDLRRVATQNEMLLAPMKGKPNEGPDNLPTLRLADPERDQAGREPNVVDPPSRAARDPRRGKVASRLAGEARPMRSRRAR